MKANNFTSVVIIKSKNIFETGCIFGKVNFIVNEGSA